MDLNLIRIILIAIFLCIGTVGNILSFITVINKHCKKSSYTVYLAALAIDDFLILFMSIFDAYGRLNVSGINMSTNPLYCKLHLFVIYTFSGISIWLIVLLALERTFCMYFPFKVKSVCKPKTALIATTLLVTLFAASNAHYIYGMQLQSGNGRHGDSTFSSPDMNESTGLGRKENVTLTSSKEDVFICLDNQHKKHNNNSNIIGEFHGFDAPEDFTANNSVEMDLESDSGIQCFLAGACNFSETKSDMKHINQTGQSSVGDCNLKSGNISEPPPAANCISSDSKTIDQPEQQLANTCNSSGRRDDDATSLLENSFKENFTLKSRIVTQSANDKRDSYLDVNTTKSTLVPTDLDNDTKITTFCGFLNQNYIDFYRSWAWFEGTLYFWFPVLILVTANTATWIKVYRSSRGIIANMAILTLRRTRHVVILTSLISVGFIVFVTPITMLFLLETLIVYDINHPLSNEENRAVLELIAECLYLCNHSFNFFFYILSGERFRNSLKAIFCKQTLRQGTPDIQFELKQKPNNKL